MRVILPVPITPDNAPFGAFILSDGKEFHVDDGSGGHEPFLVSAAGTNIPEDDAAEWSESATYNKGDVVMAGHQLFEAAIEHDGVDPLGPATQPPTWIR